MGDQLERPEVRWGLGCLLSGIALTGVVILVLFVAILAQPPAWLQVAMGLGIVAGAGIFTWILASALGRARREERAHRGQPEIKLADAQNERRDQADVGPVEAQDERPDLR